MGLGKTLQALAIADYYSEDWPLLFVCPLSMCYQWQTQIVNHLLALSKDDVYICGSLPEINMSEFCVVIIAYDTLPKLLSNMVLPAFRVVIIDECHHVKNPKALRTDAVKEVCKSASRRILLSGTPALSRPDELFSQLQIVDPELFKSFTDFGDRYCGGVKGLHGVDYSGSTFAEELSVVLDHFFIRRLKKDVLLDLPPKTREIIHLNSGGDHPRAVASSD